ncbi:MAG: hypothetical protein DRP63_00185 [Planctomycetota bacterium]|nr:MAG: hypothetical protein DRP63_00185 [Planctomycetota bacterium]
MSDVKKSGGMDKGSWVLMMLAFVFGVLLVMALCTPRRSGLGAGALRVFSATRLGDGRVMVLLEDGTVAVLRSSGTGLVVEAEYRLRRQGGRLFAERLGGGEALFQAQKGLFERFCKQANVEAALDVARQLAQGEGFSYLRKQLKKEGICGDVAALVLGERGDKSAAKRLLQMLSAGRMREKVLAALAALTGKTPPHNQNPLQFYKNLLGEKR